MNKSLFTIIVLTVVFALAIVLTHCTSPEPQPMTVSVELMYKTIAKADAYADTLESEGYSSDWAHHKAYVEYELLPSDSLYIAIEED